MFDPLYSAVAAGDKDAVVRALRGRTEPERRAAAPAVVRAARADRWNTMLGPDGELVEGRTGDRHTRALKAALLGTATVSEMRRCGELVDYVHTVPALAERPPRTYAALLEPFDELCAQTGTRVTDSRAFLETVTGSSKAAKLARALLARTGEPPDSERELLLQARIARAQRWIG